MYLKIMKNDYTFNLLNKLFTVVIGLVTSAFLTRYLGVVYKGEYSYIIQIVAVLTIILNMGIHQSYSFFYRKNNGNVLEQYISIYFFQFIIHLLLTIVISIFIKNIVYIYIILLLPFSIIKQRMESTMAVENIRLKIKLNTFSVIMRMLSFISMFLFLDTSLFPPVILTIALSIITVAIYIYFSNINWRMIIRNRAFSREVVNYSWVPMLTALLITLNYSVDIFFLKHIGTPIELGLYSTAVGIINYFWLIPDSFKEVLLSKVAREYSIKSTLLAIKISVLSVILVILGFVFLGKIAINILYGSEFLGAYNVTLILAIGAISMVFYKMIGVVLLSEGKRWVYFFSLLISVIANIISNIIMIPKYGMYGAAFSSIISYSICGISFLMYFIKNKNLKIKDVVFLNSSEINMFIKKIKGKKND